MLRGVLDEHSRSIQSSQIIRKRNYSTVTYYDVTPPENLPNWAYYFEGEAKESEDKHKRRRVDEPSIHLEEHQTRESALMGKILGAIAKVKSVEGSTEIGKKKTIQKKRKSSTK